MAELGTEATEKPPQESEGPSSPPCAGGAEFSWVCQAAASIRSTSVYTRVMLLAQAALQTPFTMAPSLWSLPSWGVGELLSPDPSPCGL